MSEAAKKVEEKPRSVILNPGRMQLAHYERNEWVVNAPDGCTIEDCKEPVFWSHMAEKMKPYDRVEIRADNGTWVADAIVAYAERTWAHVHILTVHKMTMTDHAKDAVKRAEVKWKGPQHKWSVVDAETGNYIKKAFPSQEEAELYLTEYNKQANTG